MQTILIVSTDFNASADLAELLKRRRLDVHVSDTINATADTLIVSAKYEAAQGGTRGITEQARKAGVKAVTVLDEAATEFTQTAELGGRLNRIGMPMLSADMMSNAHLLMAANVIGGLAGAMAAGAETTGQLIDLAKRVARTDVTVFINGPTGSGKEVLARQVHNLSRRADKPFVAINCAAIPENMLEAILFGHEKGAFTGAAAGNKGIIRAADGGTLLLDEISEMPMGLQSKLLRVLQERTVTPIGSQNEVPVDIRIIATSNRDMPSEVRQGRFREDLYYRLNVFPLATQPLQKRGDDIPVLASVLIARHCPADMTLPVLTPEAITSLRAHDWPGNVRELENVIQRALVLSIDGEITAQDLVIDAGNSMVLSDLAEAV